MDFNSLCGLNILQTDGKEDEQLRGLLVTKRKTLRPLMSLTWRIPVTTVRGKRGTRGMLCQSLLARCCATQAHPVLSPCTSAGEPTLTGSALRLPAPAAALLQTGTSAASLSSSFPKADSCTVLTGTTRLLLASNTILSSKTPIFPARSARSCLRSTLLWGFRGRAEAGAAGSSRSTRGWARRLAEPPLASRSPPGCSLRSVAVTETGCAGIWTSAPKSWVVGKKLFWNHTSFIAFLFRVSRCFRSGTWKHVYHKLQWFDVTFCHCNKNQTAR